MVNTMVGAWGMRETFTPQVIIIGLGNMGTRRAKIAKDFGYTVWGVDVNSDNPNFNNSPCDDVFYSFSMVKDLMRNTPVKVMICTGPHQHLEMLQEVMDAGCKDIFVEKPLATRVSDLPEIPKNVRVSVGANWIQSEVYHNIKNKLGYSGILVVNALAFIDKWPKSSYKRESPLWEMGPHHLSILEYLGGPIRNLTLHIGENYAQFRGENTYTFSGVVTYVTGDVSGQDNVLVRYKGGIEDFTWNFLTGAYGDKSIKQETLSFLKTGCCGIPASTAMHHVRLLSHA